MHLLRVTYAWRSVFGQHVIANVIRTGHFSQSEHVPLIKSYNGSFFQRRVNPNPIAARVSNVSMRLRT